MSGGIQKLAEQLAELASSQAMMAFENWTAGIDSPIERLMYVGISCLVPSQELVFFPILNLEIVHENSHHEVLKRASEYGCMVIQMQHRLLDWKADFVLSCPSISTKKVIVECDGHAFHERTKEQAARDRSRDRAAQQAGHIMLRFTGSEIYRDPLGCSRSAIETLARAIEPDWMARAGLEK
jgi:very-short-patch-repair endonuclease